MENIIIVETVKLQIEGQHYCEASLQTAESVHSPSTNISDAVNKNITILSNMFDRFRYCVSDVLKIDSQLVIL